MFIANVEIIFHSTMYRLFEANYFLIPILLLIRLLHPAAFLNLYSQQYVVGFVIANWIENLKN